ncbi:hypothetical protein [Pantoea nemavictus]|uniref:Uncharacterized protein n=1 Tax=Pantoea nemavictus TaxID=2726955 RepID=A0ABU8PT11_9GAMM|nr:hypothetical protein [Pantoea nemavictus]
MENVETQISQHISGFPESLVNYLRNDYEDDLMVVIEDLLPLDLQQKMEDGR